MLSCRYIVKDLLGHGTFGQVAKCWVPESCSFLAVKIIKNQPAYSQQALVEVSILTTVVECDIFQYVVLILIVLILLSLPLFFCLQLNKKYDPEDKHHIVRIYDYFVCHQHLCICFELLDTNL